MSAPRDNTVEEVEAVIARVAAQKAAWAKLSAQEKLNLLNQVIDRLKTFKDLWASAAAEGHGYSANNPAHAHLVGEVLVKGPAMFGSWAHTIRVSYESLVQTGKMPAPLAVSDRPDGSKFIRVAPWGVKETVALAGQTLEVVVEKGAIEQFNPCNLPAGVVGVLAAGNFDAPIDILHTMFLENKVTICKANPVNNHSASVIAQIFEPLTARNFLGLVVGGIEQGQKLVHSPLVDEVLMTGSARSYDKIMWGNNVEKKGEPGLKKPFKAELGSVNPYIVCPGQWTDAQMDEQAQLLVSAKLFNSGHICASPQVVITSKNWPQREAFLQKVREYLEKYPATRAYYPGAEQSYQSALKSLTDAVDEKQSLVVNQRKLIEGQQSTIFATGLQVGAYTCGTECFCPVLSEIPLDTAADTGAFLPKAVDTAHSLWGSLTCTVIVDPVQYAAHKDVVEKALDDLKFGAIGLNQWAGLCVFSAQLPWGAYPRHTIYDVQSGIGKIGNSFCIKNISKSIVRSAFSNPAHFKVPLKPAAGQLLASRLTDLKIHDTVWRLAKLLFNSITGW